MPGGEAMIKTITSEPVSPPGYHEPTILVVDDDPANLSILSNYLQEFGFRVIVARDGESALEKAQYGQPDLILLDLLMPKMDGFETCRRLKAKGALRDTPVIFMTGLTDAKDKVNGFQAGGVDYIIKPFQYEEVLARIKTHLDLHLTQQQLGVQNTQLQHQISERERAEGESHLKTAFLEALVHRASIDGILVVDSQARKILQNQRMAELWEIPPAIANERNHEAQLNFVTSRVKHPEQFIEKVNHLYYHADKISRDEIELKNGTVLD